MRTPAVQTQIKPLRRLLAFALLAFAAFLPKSQADAGGDAFAIKDGDRVLFYGDSITEQNYYNTYVETYVLTRFPGLNVSFEHAGWGGDSVRGGGGGPIDVRLDRDVIPYKPTVLTIMLGMNDGRYRAFDQEIFDAYSSGYRHILDRVESALPTTRTYLIQPSPYDDVTRPPMFEGGYNGVLIRFSGFVRDLAAQHHLQTVDLNSPVVAALERAKEIDPVLAPKLLNDRVHPDVSGHLVMAAALLKAWNAPMVVTTVALDSSGGKVLESQNTRVSDFKVNGNVSWKQLDGSLPFPIHESEPLVALADKAGGVTASLNQQILRVTGLPGGAYALRIDGERVASFGAADLERGVNLALLDTPMYRIADEIQQLSIKHNRLHFLRWRSAQIGLGEIKTEPVTGMVAQLVAEMDKEEAAMVARQHELAQPRSHSFELAPEVR